MTRDESKHTGLTQDLAVVLSYDYVNCLCLDMVYRSCDTSHPRSPMNSNPDLPDCLSTAYRSSSIDGLVSRLHRTLNELTPALLQLIRPTVALIRLLSNGLCL